MRALEANKITRQMVDNSYPSELKSVIHDIKLAAETGFWDIEVKVDLKTLKYLKYELKSLGYDVSSRCDDTAFPILFISWYFASVREME